MIRRLSAAILTLVCACTGVDELSDPTLPDAPEPSTAITRGAASSPGTLLRDDEALAALPAHRQNAFAALEASSSIRPQLSVDQATGAVLSIRLDWQGPKSTIADNARAFIDSYQVLLDERVKSTEYVRQTQRAPCANVVTYDRHLFGKQVVGSRLTLHFSPNGRLAFVTNGVAPVPAKLFSPKPTDIPGWGDLKKMTGKAPSQSVKRVAVIAPMYDGSGVHEADVAAWFDSADGRQHGTLAMGDFSVSRRFDAQDDGAGRTGGTAKSLSDPRTDVPALVRYADMVQVASFAAERNPLESAYRFLEEHPSLYRTGAARCQYVPTQLDENPTIPGLYSVRLSQQHGTLPVFGAELVVQLDGVDRISSIAGRARGNIEVPTTPAKTSSDAVNAARAVLTRPGVPKEWQQAVSEGLAATPKAELVVFPQFLDRSLQQKKDYLAWKVQLGSFTFVYDAMTLNKLYDISSRHLARVVRDAEGDGVLGLLTGYHTVAVDGVTISTSPPPHGDIFPGLDSITGGLPTAIEDYNNMLLRNGHVGMNGRGGGDFVVNTNVNIEFGGCPNAFFDSYVTWNAYMCAGEASADVAGHELTHGVLAATSGLWMSDESGAINEAYSDLFGDLADRTGNALIGETTADPRFRDMLNPGSSRPAQPAHYSGYVPRTSAACAGAVFPWDCDFGNVHTNSGIINRAHRLLSGGLAGSFAGIGDERLERLAITVATTRLPANATMNMVAGATRDTCEQFVARGVTTAPSGLTFTLSHCDAVTNAFRQVGLDPFLSTGWTEPRLGFAGTETFFGPSGGVFPTTPGLCPVSNILLQHQVPLLTTTLFADYAPATPMPSSTSILGFISTTGFNVTGLPVGPSGPLPLGTPLKFHRVDWTSAYGVRPTFTTQVQFPATCSPPPVETRPSVLMTRGYDVGVWTGSSTAVLGNATPTSLPASCILRSVNLEQVDGAGNNIGRPGPGGSVVSTITHWFVFVPVDFNATVTPLSVPAGRNMSGTVRADWDLGRTVRTRWRYEFSGTGCNPL